jgi:hypothetical protein
MVVTSKEDARHFALTHDEASQWHKIDLWVAHAGPKR